MPESNLRVPVVLFVFNRPDFTKQVLDKIALVKPRKLFVVADGPRKGHPDDERLVRETRAVVDRVDWPAELLTLYSDANLGCNRRIASGVDWVFEHVPEAIFLEDDCLPHPTFFSYCEELLTRYREDERVQMIGGSNVAGSSGPYSYYFSRCYQIWGWATWARAWRHYDEEMHSWPERRRANWLQEFLGDKKGAKVVEWFFDQAYAGRIPAWDFFWVFSGWARGAVSVTPSANLVTNIGFGEKATHQRNSTNPSANRPVRPMSFPMRHPPDIEILERADREVFASLYSRNPQVQPLPRRLARRLRHGRRVPSH